MKRALVAILLVACGGAAAPAPKSVVVDAVVPPPSTPPPAPAHEEETVDPEAAAAVFALQAMPFRFAADLEALRATPTGPAVIAVFSAIDLPISPATANVDVFADGKWAVGFGASLAMRHESVIVVRHQKKVESDATRETAHPDSPQVIVWPRSDVVALVPRARKDELTGVIARGFVKLAPEFAPSEIVRAHWSEISGQNVPPELKSLDLGIRARDGGGLALEGHGTCDDADACKRAAIALHKRMAQLSTPMFRIATGGVFGPLATDQGVHAEGSTIVVSLEASRIQVDRLTDMAKAFVGAR